MISYGMHLSASGALTSMYRQDVITNNLANATTPAFKPDLALQIARDPARVEDALFHLPSTGPFGDLLERLGGGTHVLPNIVAFAQGPLEQTGEPLDLAVKGDGFFTVRDPGAPEGVRLTRDGRLTRNADGLLVMAATGLAVLDEGGGTITIDPALGPPEVSPDGTVRQGGRNGELGQVIGRIALVDVPDRRALKKLDAGLFEMPPGAAAAPASGELAPGYVEGAAVDEISAMMSVASASRAVQSNLAMISYHDQMMEQAVRTLGRVG